MRTSAFLAIIFFFAAAPLRAAMTITPWHPLYKGIEHAVGTNTPDPATINHLQVANCLKIDLGDPDVRLFTTPRTTNYLVNSRETPSTSITTFIRRYGVQVATDANFYSAITGESDPSSEGIGCNAFGLLISNGDTVSPPDTSKYASLLFTTNKVPSFRFNNVPPGTNTAGIFTAVTGYYPVLSNGVNVGDWAVANYPDADVHLLNPRTIFGISQDHRYLYMITIDGRQSFSEGAEDRDSGTWAKVFGAWDAINMDGGGSTAMYMADCGGNPIALNSSSYLALNRGHERYIGSHLGIYARPVPQFINDVRVVATDSSANVLWTTDRPTGGGVNYGLTASYGSSAPAGALQLTKHVVTLKNLVPNTTNYFRINATGSSGTYTRDCSFVTSNVVVGASTLLFDVTKSWRYNWTNLNGINWTALGYNDSGWAGPGPGLLFVETNNAVAPRNTLMPTNTANGGLPFTNYYFRTHFTLNNNPAGASLTFSNYIDDGAVFYLNGSEIYRLRMPAGLIAYSTLANGLPCANQSMNGPLYGDACTVCPDVFTIPADYLTNLAQGDNVLAVEVHNQAPTSRDLVFGSALFFNPPPVPIPKVNILVSEGTATLWWNGTGFKIQQANSPLTGAAWTDVGGPVTNSPFLFPNFGSTRFFRLKN